jgi:hypothetical protein
VKESGGSDGIWFRGNWISLHGIEFLWAKDNQQCR